MAAAKNDEPYPSPLAKYQELKRQLEHAVLVDVPASEFADKLMTFDAPSKSLLPEGSVALEADSVEVGLAWVPASIPVTFHLYLDQKPIPGAGGTEQGGLLRFSVPPGMYKPGSRLFITLRFLVGGWKYQLWMKAGGVTHTLEQAKDPNPNNPKDDFIPKGYVLP